MCKHSKEDVTSLEKRQRGLDARGNDPLATKRESEWAVKIVSEPSNEDKMLTVSHVEGLVEKYKTDPRAKEHAEKLEAALLLLPDDPTGIQLTEMLLDNNSGFKKMMDEIGNKVGRENPNLKNQGRDQPFFQDRGRRAMQRRASFSDKHGGIVSSRDGTDGTKDIFTGNVQHAKGENIGDQTSNTYQKFQKSGAPFVGGASGTLQMISMELETQKKRTELTALELAEREKLLMLTAARLVAGGHHSMTECLLAVKAYGYFDNIPDPLTDYNASMKSLEKHLVKIGLAGGDKPLSRDSETRGVDKNAVKYQDRLSAVQGLFDRYSDQLPANEKQAIELCFQQAEAFADAPNYKKALEKLDFTATKIKGQVALITANARGSNKITTSQGLVAKLGTTTPRKVKNSTEYKAVQGALDDYTKVSKELKGRKLDHDMAALGFEELRAALAKAKKGAEDYNAKYRADNNEKGRRDTMTDLIAKIDAELNLLEKVQRDLLNSPKANKLTIEQAVEFARFDIDVSAHAEVDELTDDKINKGESKANFGAGKVNTVAKLVFDTTTGKETRIFKPEKESEKLVPAARNIGINPDKPNFGKRNIASRKACDQLGLGDLIPKADFITFNGELGLAMGEAPGKAPVVKRKFPIEDGGLNLDDYRMNPGNYKDVSIVDGKYFREKAVAVEIPFEGSNPASVSAAIQKGMMDMQWLDGFVGQVDRQPENYMINVDPDTNAVTVTGIDNDFSFGANLTGSEKLNMGNGDEVVNPNTCTGDGKGFNYCGNPPLIDRALYDRLVTNDLQWADFSRDLGPLISPQELLAAQGRFNDLKTHATQLGLDGKVVDNWETFTKDGKTAVELMKEDPRKNYFNRDVALQDRMGNTESLNG